MSASTRTVLITGCSDGGLGAALAVAFHQAGLKVYATARNPDKMKQLAGLGIKTLELDVLSEASIAECVSKVSALDILVNNAGTQFTMPVVDINILEAKKAYDLNVWSHIAVSQAFLPLLLKSRSAMIVNQTSVASVASFPFQGVYSSSKAAMAMLSDAMRLELQPFGIKVVDLKTGVVQTNLIANMQSSHSPILPKGSIYEPVRDKLEAVLRQDDFVGSGMKAEQWAEQVAKDLLAKNPPWLVWKGESAALIRLASVLPFGMFDGTLKKTFGLDVVEKSVRK